MYWCQRLSFGALWSYKHNFIIITKSQLSSGGERNLNSNCKLLKNDLTLVEYLRRYARAGKDKHEAADDKQDDGDNIKACSPSSRAPTITSSVVAPVNNLLDK